MLRFILLGFLNYLPLSGYQLKTLIDQSTGHFWHAYHSQIYTTLKALEDQGFVTSQTDEGDDRLKRRTYEITEAGRAELTAWLSKPMLETAQIKDELLVRVFFSGQRDQADVIDELRIQRRLHQQQLEAYMAIAADHLLQVVTPEAPPVANLEADSRMWTATLDYGIRYERMVLEWIDTLVNQLKA
jgi:DNA-binding PadR family transcriptional regulator